MGLLIAGVACSGVGRADDPLPTTVRFNRDVRPILSDACYKCHGPDSTQRKEDLRLDTRTGLFAKRDESRIVTPGKPSASELFRRIAGRDADTHM
ncbi:MAG: c-type cytochrome domain-containing protein, partial [Planctomycetaceae bacterium]